MFIVATNVVASRPPEYRLTGTATARAEKHYGLLILGAAYGLGYNLWW